MHTKIDVAALQARGEALVIADGDLGMANFRYANSNPPECGATVNYATVQMAGIQQALAAASTKGHKAAQLTWSDLRVCATDVKFGPSIQVCLDKALAAVNDLDFRRRSLFHSRVRAVLNRADDAPAAGAFNLLRDQWFQANDAQRQVWLDRDVVAAAPANAVP